MNNNSPYSLEIGDDDIEWVCRVLKLPPTAFSGKDGNDSRLCVIKSLSSLDVEACPGSGKTTLLVAKLAILARHWTDRRRGICVLSHTNVARREIETRLGGTPEGKLLLSYPHFVGTIHGFVNEFLALPWLRSKPYPIRVIDDDICLKRRWFKLPRKIRFSLTKNGRDEQVLRVAGTDFSIGVVPWGKGGTLSTGTETWQALQRVCRESCEEGYFCYSEMFLWAAELLDHTPKMREALRERFPLLFVDEVQDTSEQQSAFLFRLFMDGEGAVIRQRFGDSNQAIYQYSSQKECTLTDPFPDPNLKRTIPNSHRFGQQIADLADPLGVTPQGLVGLGPSRRDEIPTNTDNRHTIFLFDDQTIGHVMPSYAAYLLEVFSESELRDGTFTAIGATHRPKENDKVPRYVAHYWSEYDYELTATEPRPTTFLQYVAAGWALARSSGEVHYVVNKIADGILRLTAILNSTANLSARKRSHRYVRELLAGHPEAHRNYAEIVSALTADGAGNAVPSNWRGVWAPKIKAVSEVLSGTSVDSAEATAFLAGQAEIEGYTQPSSTVQRDNVFRFPRQNPKVEVHVGSIHSVKGKTHTATLVLDTYYRKHHLEALKPWLLGKKSGGGVENDALLSRLRQHYVAMTRPSHLVCLAMREDCLTNVDVTALQNRGWRVTRVNTEVPEWL
jgi:DNA helicase-2/ATP-dependent DNA helicase PcrA